MRLIPKSQFSEALHTALRKCCDSTPTSIAWNAIYLLPKGVWGKYVTHMEGSISGTKDLAEQVKKASFKFYLYGSHGGNILRCAFEEFSKEDWEGYSSFLKR